MTTTQARGRLREHLARSALGAFGSRFLGGIGGIIVARALGPAARGELAVVIVTGSIIGSLASGGLEFWILRAAQHREVNDAVRAHLRAFVVVVGSISLAAFLLLLALDRTTPALIVLLAGSWAIGTVASALPTALLRMNIVAASAIAASMTYLVGALVLSVLDYASGDSVAFLVAMSLVVPLAFAVPLINGRPAGTPSGSRPTAIWAVMRQTWPSGVGEALQVVAQRLDVVLVAWLLGVTEAGLYVVALALTEILTILPDSVAQVAIPWLSQEKQQRERGLFYLLLLGAIPALLVAVGARPLIESLFGDAFSPAADAVPLLCIAALVLGLYKLAAARLSARGSDGLRGTSMAVGTAIMLLLDLLLLERFGLAGAACASISGYTVATGIALRRRAS